MHLSNEEKLKFSNIMFKSEGREQQEINNLSEEEIAKLKSLYAQKIAYDTVPADSFRSTATSSLPPSTRPRATGSTRPSRESYPPSAAASSPSTPAMMQEQPRQLRHHHRRLPEASLQHLPAMEEELPDPRRRQDRDVRPVLAHLHLHHHPGPGRQP